MYKNYILIFSFLTYFSVSTIEAQSNYVVISNVNLDGNNRTKDKVIYRELDIFPGDTIFLNSFSEQVLLNEKRLLSTSLFTDVNINIKNWDTTKKTCDIAVEVQENWYLYPSIIFELADRNFSVWWKEQGRSLDRVNYGLRLDHINLTGNRDRLKVKAQFGYTRKYELGYDYPYLNNKWGFSTKLFYSENKEIGYITKENKTLFRKLEDERKLRSRFRVGGSINYRPGLYAYHALRLEFHHNSIDEFVAQELNPDYFLNGRVDHRFFLIEYDLQYDKRIFFQYPEGGHLLFFNVKKKGVGVFDNNNILSVNGGIEKHIPYKKWIYAARIKGKANLLRDKISFADNTALGYGRDKISGYELYVIDGTDYLLFQSAIKYKLFDTVHDLGDNMPLRQFRRMTVKLFLRFNFDSGYVNDPSYRETNSLNNKWVHGYGPAVDIILWNTFIIKAEYSFNQLGESGFILQSGLAF